MEHELESFKNEMEEPSRMATEEELEELKQTENERGEDHERQKEKEEGKKEKEVAREKRTGGLCDLRLS